MRKTIICLSIILIGNVYGSSQSPLWDKPMQLKKCSISIKADVFTATTFIEMEFYNPNNREIEGLYRFELKAGQVITAFQLELNGKYRDGSIEEKWKATNAYNTIVGKRIDPALLTMEYADHYSLRIYPVPAKGTRKITMTIQQMLKPENNSLHYELPLNVPDTVREFNLDISVQSGNATPAARRGLIAGKTFGFSGHQYFLEWNTTRIILKNPLIFFIPISENPVLCTKQHGQKIHFALRFKPAFAAEYVLNPKQLVVFWDVSASSSKRNIGKEMNFLKQFISYHHIKQLTIVSFNHALQDTAVFYTSPGLNNGWQQYLRNIEYDGSTQLGIIDFSGWAADLFMLFTDGKNTHGMSKPKTGNSLIYCINSSPEADAIMLNNIVGTNGGKLIDLNKLTLTDAISINSKAKNWLLNITSSGGKTIMEQSLPLKMNAPVMI